MSKDPIRSTLVAERERLVTKSPQSAHLGPTAYKNAMRRAITNVKAFSADEVRGAAKVILDNAAKVSLTSEVEMLLRAASSDTKRQGLVLFAVDNHGLVLAQQQEREDDLAEDREERATRARQLSAESRQIAADIVRARTAGIRFLDMVTHPKKPTITPPREVIVETVLTPDEAEMLRQEFLRRVNHHGVYDQFMRWLKPCQLKNMYLVLKHFRGKASTAVAQQTRHLVAARRIFADFLSEVSP